VGPGDGAVLAAGAVGVSYLVSRVRRLPRRDHGPEAAPPRRPIAVIVPARDEAGNLAHLLTSLAAQHAPPAEVVVVDDHSSDGTADVARAHGATVVRAPPLPDGWSGKAHACSIGARATTSPVLLFLDADVRLAPDAIGRIERSASEHDDRTLVSVQPHHVPERPYEQLSALFNVVSWAGVRRHASRNRTAFGPCLRTTRAAYEAVGGHAHERVRGHVLDDVRLARRYPATATFAGGDAVRFRMYPGGLGQLVEGWSKNVAAGAATVTPAGGVAAVAWIAALIRAPFVHPLAYLGAAASVAIATRRTGRFHPLTAVLYPLPLLGFLAIFGWSAARRATRRPARWRGRALPA
jgi:4,4'-diaponeurosporenoate glycosyltransferase